MGLYNIALFDLDGTLTDPKIGITKSFQYALSAFGIQEETENLTKFIGPPLRESFSITYGFSNSDTEKAVAKFREYFSETGLYENTVYPGIPEMLQALKKNNIVLAVATSKVTVYARKILKHFDLVDYFDFLSGDEMDGRLTKNGKRDIVRMALDALDSGHTLKAVMIGDREHDIIGANENGLDSIGVLWGYGSRVELESAGATMIACSPNELIQLM